MSSVLFGAFRCSECGADIECVEVEEYPVDTFAELAPKTASDAELYVSQYSAARVFLKFTEFVGWVVAAIGLVLVFLEIQSSVRPDYAGTLLETITLSFCVFVIGVALITSGQLTRATVDNADHTREILKILKGSGVSR